MKNHKILYIINKFSESLSVTNDYHFIIETALDSLIDTLQVDCCWIQLTSIVSEYPHLASFRNFNDRIQYEMSRLDVNNYFIREVIGLGNKVIIPRLPTKADHILAVFKQEGYSSMIAVPINNYKTLGIMGAAYRKRNKFSKSFSELFATIANILGMTLYRHIVINHRTRREDSWQRDTGPEKTLDSKEDIEENISLISNRVIKEISSLIHNQIFP